MQNNTTLKQYILHTAIQWVRYVTVLLFLITPIRAETLSKGLNGTALTQNTMTVLKTVFPTGAKIVGEGRLTYLFFDVYDARLFSKSGTFSWNKPFALELSYLREIKGTDIVKGTITGIEEQGFSDKLMLSAWYNQLLDIFPDVDSTTQIIGMFYHDGSVHFYKNSVFIGKVTDKNFGKRFFGIWLAKSTRNEDLREKLLSANVPAEE